MSKINIGVINKSQPLTNEFCASFLAQGYTHVAINDGSISDEEMRAKIVAQELAREEERKKPTVWHRLEVRPELKLRPPQEPHPQPFSTAFKRRWKN